MSNKHSLATIALGVICAMALQVQANTLPSKVCFSVANPGDKGMPTYFDATISGVGFFDAWCGTPDKQIVYNTVYTALVLTPAEASGYVMYPENFDLVAWVIDQDFVGKPSVSGGMFTMGDVQNAIWLLIDDSLSVDQGPSDPERVDEILALAAAYGEGYPVGHLRVLVPVAKGCDLNTTKTDLIAQVILIEVMEGPGTGTPGYWMNHPNAWPVEEIEIGGVMYTKAEAIAKLATKSGDKRWTIFASLMCAKLNILIGNEGSCVAEELAFADAWWAVYNGSGVAASSAAWKMAEPWHLTLDAYNNGRLCAPARD